MLPSSVKKTGQKNRQKNKIYPIKNRVKKNMCEKTKEKPIQRKSGKRNPIQKRGKKKDEKTNLSDPKKEKKGKKSKRIQLC